MAKCCSEHVCKPTQPKLHHCKQLRHLSCKSGAHAPVGHSGASEAQRSARDGSSYAFRRFHSSVAGVAGSLMLTVPLCTEAAAWAHSLPVLSRCRAAQGHQCLSVQPVLSTAQAPLLQDAFSRQQDPLAQSSAGPSPAQDSLPIPPPQQESDPTPDFPPIPRMLPPLAELQIAPVHKVQLGNGLVVFMMEDHEVPIVKAALVMKGGRHASPPDKGQQLYAQWSCGALGLATIAASVQRGGGTVSLKSTELDDELDALVAEVELGAASDSIGLGFSALREDVGRVMHLAVDVLTSPAVPEQRLDMNKKQVLDIIRHSRDDPAEQPRRALLKQLYGPTSVYARRATEEQVNSITRQDVLDFLKAWERPDGAFLGIVGDFEPSKMQQLIEAEFGQWQVDASQPQQQPVLPTSPLPTPQGPHSSSHILLIDRPDATQTTVVMGELGVGHTDPAAPALDVLSTLLNGFGGSLFEEIRSRQGLAYSIGGGFETSPVDHPGLFVAEASTAFPAQLLDLLTHSLQDVVDTGPAEEAVQAAKRQALNSFVFNVSSSQRQLQQLLASASHGLPEDEVFRYRDKVQAVDLEALRAAAQAHLHPAQQVVIMAADAKVLVPLLESRGYTVSVFQAGDID